MCCDAATPVQWWCLHNLDKVLHPPLVISNLTVLHLAFFSSLLTHHISCKLLSYLTPDKIWFLSHLIYQHPHVLKILTFPCFFWIVLPAWNILFSLLWNCFSPPSGHCVEASGLEELYWDRICWSVEGKSAGVTAEGDPSSWEAMCHVQRMIPVTP